MRKIGFKIGVIAFLATVSISCSVTEDIVEEVVDDMIGSDDRIVSGEVSINLISDDNSDTTISTIQYSYFSTQFSSNLMDSTYKDTVNAMIRRAVISETMTGEGFTGQPLTEHFFKAQMDSVVKEWDNYKDVESNPWEIEMSIGILDGPNSVELHMGGWSYTGGAHGNGYSGYYHIDKKTGNILSVEDYFSDMNQLNQIAEKHFRKLFDLSPTESLNDYGFWFDNDEFSVNDNFTTSDGKMLFYYNTYEIAPYAGGPTELYVPLDEIKHLMMREF